MAIFAVIACPELVIYPNKELKSARIDSYTVNLSTATKHTVNS